VSATSAEEEKKSNNNKDKHLIITNQQKQNFKYVYIFTDREAIFKREVR
tara:strand:- start:864 stop:1010 length:147 start_codon:yes stop_codon:yes gene_type:complete